MYGEHVGGETAGFKGGWLPGNIQSSYEATESYVVLLQASTSVASAFTHPTWLAVIAPCLEQAFNTGTVVHKLHAIQNISYAGNLLVSGRIGQEQAMGLKPAWQYAGP